VNRGDKSNAKETIEILLERQAIRSEVIMSSRMMVPSIKSWVFIVVALLSAVLWGGVASETIGMQVRKASHPTKLTGFGSRSIKKSILAAPNKNNKRPLLSKANAKLWIQRNDDELKFKSSGAGENCILAFTVENGDWKMQRQKSTGENAASKQMWVPVEGIYGVYSVPSGVIWVLITSSSNALTSEPWGEVRKVESMEMIYLPSTTDAPTQRQGKEQIRQLRLLRQALKSHEFYYVVTDGNNKMDMTQSLQRSMEKTQISSSDDDDWWDGLAPDSRFFWNEPAVKELLDHVNNDYAVLLRHCIPVTSAFVGIQRNVKVNDDLMYDEVLISRRSRFRAGTRFTKRGADATGHVANYAETEQVCLIGNHTLLSHVQTRGSIPLRWSSPADVKTYRPRVRIGTDPVAQARGLQNHLLSEWQKYILPTTNATKQPQLLFLNLIDKKQDQGRLGRAFDAVLQAVLDIHTNKTNNTVTSDTVKHIWFDFHAEVKNGRWDKLGRLLKSMSPTLAEQGYFKASKDGSGSWAVDKLQNGVVRTNCMDCLDRTNVVQSIFGRYALFNELHGLTTNTSTTKKLLPAALTKDYRNNAMALPWPTGEVNHRLLWADNADAISRLYAGTPALKGDFTRTGKRTKRGALDDGVNSLQRYYLNNFMDADRQEGMDLMTGYATFTVLRDGEHPAEDAASRYARLQRADMSLVEAARALMDETDVGDIMDSASEDAFVHIKKNRRKVLAQMGGPTLDLRWLPGDLQQHMKASASLPLSDDDGSTTVTEEALLAMDHRTASDIPWWAIVDTSDEETEEDNDHKMQTSVNLGHVIGGLVAAVQAPLATAVAVLCTLGWTNWRDLEEED
jgi:hypothetical protein